MKQIIAIDFDGTMVTHAYPYVGKHIGAIPVIKKIQEQGHKIILYTMRSGATLTAAISFCKNQGIILYAVNNNPQQKHWTKSPKIYANYYIDDSCIGVPLIYDKKMSDRPFVDWVELEKMLIEKQILIPELL